MCIERLVSIRHPGKKKIITSVFVNEDLECSIRGRNRFGGCRRVMLLEVFKFCP